MDQSGIIEIKAQKNVSVSYTLNNHQPVKCSHIGADPFFYMDVDVVEEDELDLLMEMEDLDHELDRLNQKLTAYEKFSEDEGVTTEGRMAAFEEDLIDVIKDARENRYAPSIDSLLTLMEKSRLAAEMLSTAKNAGIDIQYSEQVMSARYERDGHGGNGVILINPHRKLPDTVLAFTSELRRMWQNVSGAGIHPMAFDPDQAILVNRLQAADTAVAMIRVAWEMHLSDYKSVWSRVENSSLGDVARSFAREAFLDFRTINNGEASSAAFETWFLSERCRVHDRELIQSMLAENYAKIFQAEGEIARTAVTNLIVRLGEMPFGKNYLAQYAGLIMNDPIFTEVRDRSNANFLWFIKFEKSFRKTEHELQTQAPHKRGSKKRQSQDADINAKIRESNEKAIKTIGKRAGETIISFPGRKESRKQSRISGSEKESASVVIFPNMS